MSQQHHLKLACQNIMNPIIQNASFLDQKLSPIKQKLTIQRKSIFIDLDRQSQSYSLFPSNPEQQRQWIGRILNHLNEADRRSQIHKRSSTFSESMIQSKIQEEENSLSGNLTPQPALTLDNIKLRQIVLYSHTPIFALLFFNLQPINRHVSMLMVKNFHGQILQLSFHCSTESKFSLLLNTFLLFQQPFAIVFDLTDVNSSSHNINFEEDLNDLSERVPLAYFKIKSKPQMASPSQSLCPEYDLAINSLFSHQNNKKRPVLGISQKQKNQIQQSLIEYSNFFRKQESLLLQIPNLEPKTLLKIILKINFDRKIPTSHFQRDQIKLQDLINLESPDFIQPKMNPIPLFTELKHSKYLTQTPGNCLSCSLRKIQSNQVYSMCHACSKIRCEDAYFCQKCFQDFHIEKGLLFDCQDPRNPNSSKNELQDQIQGDINLNEKRKDRLKLNQQQQKNEIIKKGRQNRILEEEKPELTTEKIQNLYELQTSAKKVIELIGGIKNPDKFYKAKHPEATNEKQYYAQIKNQRDFYQFTDKIISNQLQAFQNSLLIAIQTCKKFKNKNKSQEPQLKIEAKTPYSKQVKLEEKIDEEHPNEPKQKGQRQK